MAGYDPYDESDLTEEELIQVSMGNGVDMTIAGKTNEFRLKRNRIPLTKIQADIIVDALSTYNTEDTVQQETARRTQTLLKQKFGID